MSSRVSDTQGMEIESQDLKVIPQEQILRVPENSIRVDEPQ